ncbi:type IX secretion system sortase PorU [Taibaiella koreensis]|uniref:type IX secretion system sortase PorU n=1 Tax=Taibaiella koreensis TaxID=1268548 RepID=UPI000E59A3CA|nr:type IX secretion system sortase PorU [Taibaiella koreensis]
MMKFVLCFWLLGTVLFCLFAQQKVVISHHTVNDYNTTKGVVSEKLLLQYNSTPVVKLINIQTEPIAGLPAGARRTGSFEPDIFTGKERKRTIAFVQIPVYRIVDGRTERLVSFDLEVTETDDGSNNIAQKPTDVPHSVLASGTWYKIAVPARGIYKIDYNFLQSMGINPAGIDPANIRVYGNGGTVLPEKVTDDQPDDLIENAVLVQSTGHSFAPGDYVLFYANGPTLWSKDSVNRSFDHTSNYYENRSYYFVNFDLGPGKRIASEAATAPATLNVSAFDDYYLIDSDSFNLGSIGKMWWGYKMNTIGTTNPAQNLTVNLGPAIGKIRVRSNVANINTASGNNLTMSFNNVAVRTFKLGKAPDDDILVSSETASDSVNAPGSGGPVSLRFQYVPQGTGAAYIDYVRFNYRRQPVFTGPQFAFRSWESASLPAGENASYTLQNAPANLKVWDITNPLSPVNLEGSAGSGHYTFSRAGKSLKEFIAYDGSQFSTPVAIGNLANQDLHGMGQIDFLIVTPGEFRPAAEELGGFHRQKDGISVAVVPLDQIYNEFSSGSQDIGGIRNFIRMFYNRAQSDGSDMIRNVLFMGAASYDYKDRLGFNTNFVPTYETYNSTSGSKAYASDDFFALLDENDDINADPLLFPMLHIVDVGTGRIPAYTVQEARDYVNKVKHYTSPASFGPWRNVVTYIADDHDNNATENNDRMNHLDDCETVNHYFYDSANVYNVYKIYCDALSEVSTPAGPRYPAANQATDAQISVGTLLACYTGHGSPERWAHEAILTSEDYNAWKNKDKLPVMVTATCDFGRFDDPGQRSAGAKLTISAENGAIAMITTTQVVYPGPNKSLNGAYTHAQFSKDAQGKWRNLGEALRKGKATFISDPENNHKYAVLGDPALYIALPVHKVVTEKLQAEYDGSAFDTDTIKALGRYVISGFVKDQNDNVLDNFNGTVYVTIYDKMRKVQTVNPDPKATSSFPLQTNVIAKIQGTVTSGRFRARFIAPKDINYAYGKGKVSYYANSDVTDAAGIDSGYTVGGYNDKAGEDNDAPIVQPFIDDDKFRNGGVTGPNPTLFVKLYDDNGFNISGSSIGHNMVAILDDDVQNPMPVSAYFGTGSDDYRTGYIRNFPLRNLPDGMHTIRVKAWDVYNNSGEGTVVFEVKNKDKGFISDLYNYPNPMTNITHFVFQHNLENENMDVSLAIYSGSGQLVKVIKQHLTTSGNRTEITWDGLGEGGVPLVKGVYFYRLDAKTARGITAKAYQKLVLLR